MSIFGPELVSIQCCNCGVIFGIEKGHNESIKKAKKSFTCPNGHAQSYTENEADKLRRERDRLQQQLAQKDDELRRAGDNAVKAEKKYRKLEKRTAAGTCPCCQRTFSNMARHMQTMHPGFVDEHTAKEIPPEDKVVPLRRRRKA